MAAPKRARPLTARGVKTILTRAGIDQSTLTITDDPAVWCDLETGERVTSVKVTGPDDARSAVFHALFDRGYAVAPYSDCDYWSRPR